MEDAIAEEMMYEEQRTTTAADVMEDEMTMYAVLKITVADAVIEETMSAVQKTAEDTAAIAAGSGKSQKASRFY
ncbi:hypothetical protein AS034_07260 [[Bacillus] enclensis]|nr:hypothetical protein AS034_07260 [[Bacillus] enclensis]